MTAEFLDWYEIHCRKMDGTPMQAAWLAWQHLQSARSVAQWRLDATGEQVGDLLPGELNCPPRKTFDEALAGLLQLPDDKLMEAIEAAYVPETWDEIKARVARSLGYVPKEGIVSFSPHSGPPDPPRTTLDILQTQADWRDGQADEIAKEITRQMG